MRATTSPTSQSTRFLRVAGLANAGLPAAVENNVRNAGKALRDPAGRLYADAITRIRSRINTTLRFVLHLSIVIFLFAGFAPDSKAEKNIAPGIQTPLFTSSVSSTKKEKNDLVVRSRTVTVDVAQFSRQSTSARSSAIRTPGKPPEIAINLFDDVAVQARRSRNYANYSGSFTWIGKAKGYPQSSVLFVIRGDSVYGVIELPGTGRFSIQPNADGTHTIEQISEDATLSNENDAVIPKDSHVPSSEYSETRQQSVEISNDDGSIIDVFVAYDQDASGGSVAPVDAQSYAELFIAYTNQAYENSGINQRLWLVGSVDGFNHTDSNSGSLSADLDAARDGTISGLHSKRDEYHADLVMFLTPFSPSTCSGLAFIQTSNNSVGWEDNGFSAMEACIFGTDIFAHELGHNMGSRHDWYVDSGTTPASIGHGFISTSSYFRTIMAYTNRCNALGISCPRIPYFSNPSVSYGGASTGVASGTSTACAAGNASPPVECDADNATNFNNKALITSKFRDSRVTWTGAVNSNWTTAANWSINEGAPGSTSVVNRVPRSYDNVYIPSGLGTYPTISGTSEARELVIEHGASLNMTSGTLAVGWSWEDEGGFNATGGTVIFSGPIGVSVTSESAFNDVEIGSGSDTTVVSLESSIDIDGDLLIKAGAKLNVDDQTINLAGNWTEADATGFTPGTGIVIFDGTNQTVSKNTGVSLLDEGFSDYNDSCCTSNKPSGWDSEGVYFQGDLIADGDGAANRWRNETDGYLFTPALSLQQGITYQLQYDVAVRQNFSENDGTLSPQNVSVYLGSAQNSADMTTMLSAESAETTTSYQTRTISDITVVSSGTYYLGFRARQSGNDYTSFDNISLIGTGRLSFYNLRVANGTTGFDQGVQVANILQVDGGATADFSGSGLEVAGNINNNGTILLQVSNYLLDYDGNDNTGGSPPSSQIKTHGDNLVVSSNSGGLTRTGYTFSNWNTASDGSGTDYAGGDTYSANASARLYAQWTALTYNVNYDGNGNTAGSVPDPQSKTHDMDLVLAANSGNLERDGFTFLGWNTAADGSGTDYLESDTYTANTTVTLYAVWNGGTVDWLYSILPMLLED